MEITDMSFSTRTDERNKPVLVVTDYSKERTENFNPDLDIANTGSFYSFEDLVRICNGDTARANQLMQDIETSDRRRVREADLARNNQAQDKNISTGERIN
jgi:hypothetical protein